MSLDSPRQMRVGAPTQATVTSLFAFTIALLSRLTHEDTARHIGTDTMRFFATERYDAQARDLVDTIGLPSTP